MREKIKFDLIHAHFAWPPGYVAVELKKKFGKPCLITGQRYDVSDYPFRNEFWKTVYKDIYKNADEVVTVSQNKAEFLHRLGINNVHIIVNGYFRSMFYYKEKNECRQKLTLPANKKIALTIGNLIPVKGYDVLIKAIEMLSQKRQDFLILHIGDGPLHSDLKKIINQKKIANYFKFIGRIPQENLVDWYGSCDFFVSSSHDEGNPTVLFESLGCGKPFIGTKVGGVPEIIHSDDYGLLADAGDEKAMAENLLTALDKPWDHQKILKYSEQFTWEKIAEQYMQVFQKML